MRSRAVPAPRLLAHVSVRPRHRPSSRKARIASPLQTCYRGHAPSQHAAMPKKKASRKRPTPPTAGPLAGIRVIDMSTVLMGPYATQIMADYGADVVKVEPPEGDIMRHGGPRRNPRMGPMYLQANRNKRSVVVDIKAAGGRDVLLRPFGSGGGVICTVGTSHGV